MQTYVPPQVTTFVGAAVLVQSLQRKAMQKAFAELARIMGETIHRIAEIAVLVCRRWVPLVSVAYVAIKHPAANVARLRRHLSHSSNPAGRALYLVSEAKLGRTPPMLA